MLRLPQAVLHSRSPKAILSARTQEGQYATAIQQTLVVVLVVAALLTHICHTVHRGASWRLAHVQTIHTAHQGHWLAK